MTHPKRSIALCPLLLVLLVSVTSYKEPLLLAALSKNSVSFRAQFIRSESIDEPSEKEGEQSQQIKIFHLKTVLKNTSSETVYFVSATCSHEELFVVKKTEYFKIKSQPDCRKNSPTLISLKAGESFEKEVAVQAVVKESLIPTSLDLGFEFLEYKLGTELDVLQCYRSRHSSGSTIWSNPIDLREKK
jgi:hypothetical protein